MRTYTSLDDPSFDATPGCAVTVGTFDGVHRGHAALVERLISGARERALRSCVVTFQDMPYYHFRPTECSRLLTLPGEKAAAFGALDIDRLFVVPFDGSLAELAAEEFVREILIGRIGMKLLVIGPDFALGKDRTGDVGALRAMGTRFGFETLVLEGKVEERGAPISSTRIRECIESGDLGAANSMLGRNFAIGGAVVGGQQLGRTIGVPTINLLVNARKVLPANGVYAGRATLTDADGKGAHGSGEVPVVLNIGTRPTVDGRTQTFEFHVIGQNVATSPEAAVVRLVERLRDEQKFAELEALVVQIGRDIERAKEILQV